MKKFLSIIFLFVGLISYSQTATSALQTAGNNTLVAIRNLLSAPLTFSSAATQTVFVNNGGTSPVPITGTVNIANTTLATSSLQAAGNAQIVIVANRTNTTNVLIGQLLGVEFASSYVAITFTNSTQSGLDTDVSNWFGALISEKPKSISYSSNAVWNGLAIIREYNCFIIYTP